MPTPTYTLIQEQALGSTQGSVTFDNIPQTYKDLVLETVHFGATGASFSVGVRFNGDSNTNYSSTGVYGDGATAGYFGDTNYSYARLMTFADSSTGSIITSQMNVMSYSNSSIYKTTIVHDAMPSRGVSLILGAWRSTSQITSLTVYGISVNIAAGSTFRLWGIVG